MALSAPCQTPAPGPKLASLHMKPNSLLHLMLAVSSLILAGCASTPYYATSRADPATIQLTNKNIWSAADWNSRYGLPIAANVQTLILLEMVDGIQLNPKMGFGVMGPWKIDAGKHQLQLAVNEPNGLFRGTFEFDLKPGQTYTILAVRNSKITTDKAGVVLGLLTEIRTHGVLVPRQEGDARDYYYQLKLFDETGKPFKEAASVDAILMKAEVH